MSFEALLPRIPVFKQDANGNVVPAEGYELRYTEVGSSSTLKTIYSSHDGTTPSTPASNPQTADANGYFPVHYLSGSYRVTLTDGTSDLWFVEPVKDVLSMITDALPATVSATDILNNTKTYAVGGGTGDAITLTLSPVPSAYADGMQVKLRGYTGENTLTNPTINVNSLGVKTIFKGDGEALAPGDIGGADHTLNMIYNSNAGGFILLNPRGWHHFNVTAGGTGAALTATVPGVENEFEGLRLTIESPADNTTTTTTLAVNGGTARSITRQDGTVLNIGDIKTGHLMDLVYDAGGPRWLLMNPKDAAVPSGFNGGIKISSAADANHDITFSTGTVRDDTDAVNIKVGTAITKQLDATWAEGDNAGGLPSGVTLAGPEWLYCFVIYKADGTRDAGFDDNASATNLMAAASTYSYYAHVGSIYTNGSDDIVGVLSNLDIGKGYCLIDVIASQTFTKPPLVDFLTRVIGYGGGGGGAQASGATAGSDTVFDGMTFGGGGAATSSNPGGGGEPSSITLDYATRIACGQQGSRDSNDTPAGLAEGGECGIVTEPLTIDDDPLYPKITGGAATVDGNNGGGGGGGATTGGNGGGGAASGQLEGYPITGSISITIGAGGTKASGCGDGGDGKVKIWI